MADTEIWKAKGALKREEILSLIPRKWRLPKPLPPPSELPDVTGNEIRQYLSYREIEITETDAECIVKKATTGEWKCEEIAEAFCHRAALAHQMVSPSKYLGN
jgi:amidase